MECLIYWLITRNEWWYQRTSDGFPEPTGATVAYEFRSGVHNFIRICQQTGFIYIDFWIQRNLKSTVSGIYKSSHGNDSFLFSDFYHVYWLVSLFYCKMLYSECQWGMGKISDIWYGSAGINFVNRIIPWKYWLTSGGLSCDTNMYCYIVRI